MTIFYYDGFDEYAGPSVSSVREVRPLMKADKQKATYIQHYEVERSWLDRLLGRWPAGSLRVGFSFGAKEPGGKVEWKSAEAEVYYPKGVSRVQVELETWLNGQPIYFDREGEMR